MSSKNRSVISGSIDPGRATSTGKYSSFVQVKHNREKSIIISSGIQHSTAYYPGEKKRV